MREDAPLLVLTLFDMSLQLNRKHHAHSAVETHKCTHNQLYTHTHTLTLSHARSPPSHPHVAGDCSDDRQQHSTAEGLPRPKAQSHCERAPV